MNTKPKLTNPTDDELSAAVAEHVAGIDRESIKRGYTVQGITENAVPWGCESVPDYATSSAAVLPLLEKHEFVISNLSSDGITIELFKDYPGSGPESGCPEPPHMDVFCTASAPTFPRAACIALLRANGIEVEVAP